MIAESYIPQMLKKQVEDLCLQLYATPPISTPEDSLSRLAMDVYQRHALRAPFTLSSNDYFPELSPVKAFHSSPGGYSTAELQYQQRLASTTVGIISDWFGFPTTWIAEFQAYFVSQMISKLGPSSLLIPQV